ncbi:MAG TPA: undecaprenyldiphospho-muramoylpentapeptide beta-N-acetylglucosaminyltransferase [Anaerolineae bacterium]|nr:undecaprenyldiphospho-muramoylpentapeptide beta-N-acetylglucosaminyltransferase [Anaerolineae bacterium]
MVSGGGTGGHVYPILAVLQHLDEPDELPSEICYVGSASGLEAQLANRAGLPFRGISTARFEEATPWTLPLRLARLARGTIQSINIMDEFQPQALLATGGYVCAPPMLAARIKRVPSVMYLPDLRPGMAIRLLGRYATLVAVSFDRSRSYFARGKAVVTGYPVRKELLEADKSASRRRLGLDEDKKVVLVLGGSQGAHSINAAISSALADLVEVCQIVHISGEADAPWLCSRRSELPKSVAQRYRVYPYLHEEMIDALAAADLAVARAGAATTGEFPALGLPSILVPYPYAGLHQNLNADHMVDHEAAIRVDDADLAQGILGETIFGLLTHEERLSQLADGARRLAQPDASRRIAQLLRDMARPNKPLWKAQT